MKDKDYYSHLYQIARHLNRASSLSAALQEALKMTVDLLQLETGWIWLVEGNQNSVYLAASFNLPPALSERPELLAGWCYCIEKYLSDGTSEASNISEITCTRLKDIDQGTRKLKYHASIPISIGGQKIGLLNLLSKESQQLDPNQLSILSTISELIAITIQRTRSIQTELSMGRAGFTQTNEVFGRVILPRVESLIAGFKELGFERSDSDESKFSALSTDLDELHHQLKAMMSEANKLDDKPHPAVQYPGSPLTQRELEVLVLVQQGLINKEIGAHLFISERTVKFHLSSILSKLDAGTRTEAVFIAARRGLLN